MEIQFIAGIHGSGKTTHCKSISSIDVPHFSCSQIIKDCKKLNPTREKIASNVDSNQPSLINFINNEIKEDAIILDGHFCLFTTDYQIHEIEDSVFEAMPIKSITLITASPFIIVQRLSSRDCINHPIEKIEALQVRERERAESLSLLLGVPLSIIDTTNF